MMKRLLIVAFVLLYAGIGIAGPHAILAVIADRRGSGVVDPEFSSATINGTTLVITFTQSVSRGTGYDDTDIDLDMSTTGTNITVTYVSGDGTSQWTYTAASAAVNGETVDLDFNGDADSIENGTGLDLAAVVSGNVTNNTPQSGGQDFNDNFTGSNGDNPSGNWTEYNTTEWQIQNNELYLGSGSTDSAIIYTGQILDTTTQYAKVLISCTPSNDIYVGLIFRWTDSSSTFYIVDIGNSPVDVSLWYATSSTFGTQGQIGTASTLSIVDGDTIGVTLTGTGAATVVRIWKNPTANTPISVTEWDAGDSTPDVTLNPDTSSHEASGKYVGIYGWGYSGGGGHYAVFDNFYGGDTE